MNCGEICGAKILFAPSEDKEEDGTVKLPPHLLAFYCCCSLGKDWVCEGR